MSRLKLQLFLKNLLLPWYRNLWVIVFIRRQPYRQRVCERTSFCGEFCLLPWITYGNPLWKSFVNSLRVKFVVLQCLFISANMNEEDLHLARAIVEEEMNSRTRSPQESPATPKRLSWIDLLKNWKCLGSFLIFFTILGRIGVWLCI